MEVGRKKKVTVADMYDIAIGDMALSADQFERMSWGEFNCRFNGFVRNREERMKELRLMMWADIAPHSKKKLKPEDIIKLPSDGRYKNMTLLTKERFQELQEQWLTRN